MIYYLVKSDKNRMNSGLNIPILDIMNIFKI